MNKKFTFRILVFFLSGILSIPGCFNVKAQYTKLLDFNGINGKSPSMYGPLMLSGNVLYGTTSQGGSYNLGCIFKINTDGSGYTKLLDFSGNSNGSTPGLLTLSDNILYGMTLDGGANGRGCIFKINTDGSGYSKLLDFSGANGSSPFNILKISGSVLYGMTWGGGVNGQGCIFKINTDGGGYTKLLDFNGTTNGAFPMGSLTLSGNVLYGMTTNGGTNSKGCIFKINIDGSGYSKLFDFNNTSGQYPRGSLTLIGTDLYGITTEGGIYGYGSIFKININGSGYTKLLDFKGTENGAWSSSSLTLSGDALYSMTQSGGRYNYGCIFKISINGNSYTKLLDFDNYSRAPYGDLTLSDGILFGMTSSGGSYGYGCIFKYIPPPKVQTSTISFIGTTSPQATLNWANGDGTKRTVFVKEGTGTITNPVGNTTYAPSRDWNSKGSQLGASDYYCVYNGAGSSVSVTNLKPCTQYTVQIFEYNGPAGQEVYLTTTTTGNPVTLTTTPPTAPLAVGTQNFCMGATIANLTASAPTGSTVNWYDEASGGTILNTGTVLASGKYYAESRYTPSCISSTRALVNVIVKPGPQITSPPSPQTVCDSTGITFVVSALGSNLSYQWQQSKGTDSTWVDLSGATFPSYTSLINVSMSGYNYRCVVTDSCGLSATSSSALLTVHPLPVIASSTPSDTICEGTPLALNVSATDTSGATLTYQWQKYIPNQWENIDGQTSTVLNLTAQPDINKSYYRCVVSGLCSSNSEPAQISVTNAPAIVTQPADFSVCQGAMAGFSVNATGLDSTYQWQYSADNGSSWNDIAGANHFYFETDGTSSVNGNLYRCLVSGSCGNSVTSNAARLTLIDNPALTSQPVAQSVVEGDQASFAVSATGTGLTYQWQNNLTGNWTDIQGATESTFNISASLSNAADYRCMVSNLCASNPASLIVAAKPNITKQPVDQTVVEGTTATFNVVASGYDLAYQWQKYEGGTWNNVQAATLKVYKVQALPAQEGEYRCVITNSENVTVTSSTAWLRRCTTPTIETQPISQTICDGSTAAFNVNVAEPSVYQWQVKTSTGSAWENIPQATAASYSFTTQATSNGNAYRCKITRTCGSSTVSGVAVLTSGNIAITQQPSPAALCDGDQATFTVNASGLNTTYQWQQYGTGWGNISGATGSGYTTTVATNTHRKQYRCVVTGTCGSVTSNTVLLTRGPQVTNTLGDQTSCAGGTATFGSISAIGSGLLDYQWQKSTNQGQTWTNITGANATSYPMAVNNADNGNVYRCIVSGICGTADTSNFAALVLKNTQIESQPLNATICEGNPTELGVKVSGLDLSYQWSQSANGTTWTDIDGAVDDSLHLPVTNSMNGYKFICKVKGRCDVNWISSGIASLATIANTLSQPEVTVAPVTCVGGENNGAITTVTPTGGQSPYSYKWSNGATTQNLTALPVGQYTLTVNDINGCRRSVSKTVAYDAPISGNIAVTDVSIPGTAGGTIDPGITGGHQPLSYLWSNGATGKVARDLVAGYYSLTVTDNANCTKTFQALVNEQGAIAYMDTSALPDPETRQLDKTLSVGTIAGEAGVSPSGAATYTIPIETLPGVGGMVPQLSLVYNSQAGNGIMGWGWNLGGLSAVTRTHKTIYMDTTAKGMQLNLNDGFALNGNRLMLTGGKYGEDGSRYSPENETFDTIIAHGNFGNTGPEWFEVKAKNGMRYTYGRDSISRLFYNYQKDTIVKKAIIAWNLDSVIDLNGNYIRFIYQQDNLSSYLNRIYYGGNLKKNTPCVNSIEIKYAARFDTLPVHYGNLKGSVGVLLNNILIKNGNKIYRDYSIQYIKDDFSRLISITESAGDGKRFNPTIFKWGKYNTSDVISGDVNFNSDPDISIADQEYVNADINGDGFTDLISFYKKDGNKARVYYASNNGDGKTGFTMGEVINLGNDYSSSRRYSYSRMGTNNFGDIDGDNKTEIVVSEWNNNSGSTVKFNTYFNNEGNNGLPSQRSPSSKLIASSEVPVYAIGDINNDGYDEIVYIERGWGGLEYCPGKIYLPHKKSWIDFNVYYNSVKPDRMLISDFDGDGMQDIMVLSGNGFFIHKNNGGDLTTAFTPSNYNFNKALTSGGVLQLGDFNGDGLPDILERLKISLYTYWKLHINTGSELKFSSTWLKSYAQDDLNTNKDDDKDNILVTDFNNDGKSDIIVMDAIYKWKHNWGSSWKEFEKFKIYWYQLIDNNFVKVDSAQSTNEADALAKRFVIGDYNGDGRVELVNYGFDCKGTDKTRKWRIYGAPNLNNETGVIKSLANGLNQKAGFGYDKLTNNKVYQKTQSLKYPISTITFPLYVVDTFKIDDGRRYTISTMNYQDAMIHKQGKGFLGFAKTTQTNTKTSITVSTTTELDNTYFTPSRQIVSTIISGTDTLSKTITNNVVSSLGGKRVFIYSGVNENFDLKKGIKVKTESIFNNNGNLTKQITSVNEDFFVETKNFKRFDRFGNPDSIKITSARKGEPTFTQDQTFSYNQTGKVKTSIANGLTTQYSYDAFGNPDTVSIGLGSEARRTINLYTDNGMFLKEQINSLGYKTNTESNIVGKPLVKTDANGLRVTNKYDSWNNLYETITPEGKVVKNQVGWVKDDDPDAPNGSLYYTKSEKDGLFAGSEYFDHLGRNLRKVSIGYKGAKFFVDSWYNNKGELEKITDPYPAGGSYTFSAQYQYDELGRLKTETLKNGVAISYTFDDLNNQTKVEYSTGETFTKTFDATGQLVEATDPGGKITYHYTSAGSVREIITPGSVTKLKYDSFARQDTLIDSDAGTFSYGYNIFGELNKQIDSNGKVSTLVYDNLGRIKTKTIDTLITSYEYDLGTNAKGTLSSISNNNGIAEYSTYSDDGFCRLIQEKKKVGNEEFIYKYDYDPKGRLGAITYPSSLKIKYVYTNYDEIEEIRRFNDESLIWKIDELHATNGMLGKATYGNGKQISYGYDNNDRLNQITVPGVIDFNYQFNNKQQLDWREEKYYFSDSAKWKGFKEDFTYDEANRLKTATGGRNLTMNYADGKIQTKSDAGSFAYKNGTHRIDTLTVANGYRPPQHDLTFNGEGKVASISELIDSTSLKLFNFKYGVDEERASMTYTVNDTLKYTRYYVGNYEKEIRDGGLVRHINYIYAPTGLVAVYDQNPVGDSMYYVYTDYLGSLRCITNDEGTVKQRLSFDAWGNRRDPLTGEQDTAIISGLLFARGYTGHEHLDEMGLINMNARLYDPMLGMFISPDNYVDASNSQDYNRYTYCLNNPLMYTDPTGNYEFPPINIPKVEIPKFEIPKVSVPSLNNNYYNYNSYYYNWFNGISQNNYSYGYSSSFTSTWGGYGTYGAASYSYSITNSTSTGYSWSVYETGYSVQHEYASWYNTSTSYSVSANLDRNYASLIYSQSLSFSIKMAYETPNVQAITRDVNALISSMDVSPLSKWYAGIPVVGPALISGQYLVKGDYLSSAIWEAYAFADIFTLGDASKVKIATELGKVTFKETAILGTGTQGFKSLGAAAKGYSNTNSFIMTADQIALKDLINEASLGGRKALTLGEANAAMDLARELNYPGFRAGALDLSKLNNHWIGGPHFHFPGVGSGHIMIKF